MILADAPVLQFAVHEDGSWECVSTWFPLVAFDAGLLARADGWRLRVRGDEAEFICTNGGAAYAIGPEVGGIRVGRLLYHWRQRGRGPSC